MMSGEDRVLLGGRFAPIGWWVTFIEVPIDDVERWLVERWYSEAGCRITEAGGYPGCLSRLEPLESPWTKHLLIDAGRWTVHVCNSLLGGDPSAPGPVLSRELSCRVVIAGHSQRHGPGHEGTALWVLGPDGEPPLSYLRTVQVDCADGRWSWHQSGAPLAVERVDRYESRRKRDRLDRALLIEYLASYGIRPDDPAFFGPSRLIAGEPTTGRSVSLEALRRELRLSGVSEGE